ncbi:hypothetical protein B0T10DRAFT_166938 [Thelonectria olida]|uniref:Uncharacterized protein n=1 Tax=Thelonectria olida TaxID=1576542 RepID=A0A9P9ARL4_9HYPO|nr:hypothetical protein B0T10DRAFT_166938 [Thelonectria olida]
MSPYSVQLRTAAVRPSNACPNKSHTASPRAPTRAVGCNGNSQWLASSPQREMAIPASNQVKSPAMDGGCLSILRLLRLLLPSPGYLYSYIPELAQQTANDKRHKMERSKSRSSANARAVSPPFLACPANDMSRSSEGVSTTGLSAPDLYEFGVWCNADHARSAMYSLIKLFFFLCCWRSQVTGVCLAGEGPGCNHGQRTHGLERWVDRPELLG